MIVAKAQKIGKSYSKYLYLYDPAKEGLPTDKSLKTTIMTTEATNNPDDTFEVNLNTTDSYIVTKEGREIDTGYTSKELRRFFYLQLF